MMGCSKHGETSHIKRDCLRLAQTSGSRQDLLHLGVNEVIVPSLRVDLPYEVSV